MPSVDCVIRDLPVNLREVLQINSWAALQVPMPVPQRLPVAQHLLRGTLTRIRGLLAVGFVEFVVGREDVFDGTGGLGFLQADAVKEQSLIGDNRTPAL